MNIAQLRAVGEVARRGLSVSAAADALNMSQPAVSRQIRLLEEELGLEIFARARNRLTAVTPAGEQVIALAGDILTAVARMRRISRDRAEAGRRLTVATTHTQSRHVLPDVLRAFVDRHPGVQISIRHGDPLRIVELVLSGEADLGVTTEAPRDGARLVAMPCRSSPRVVVVPRGHALESAGRLTIEAVARFPMISFETAMSGRRAVAAAFERAGIAPRITLWAADADMIKTCVENGLGIAVLSRVTMESYAGNRLVALPAEHLFASSVTSVILRRGARLSTETADFVALCGPHWDRATIERHIAELPAPV